MESNSRIADLEAKNKALEAEVASLSSKVALLLKELSKQKLTKDSSNSSNPPSQDKFKKKRNSSSLRAPSTRKSGGQFGHEGHHLKMSIKSTIEHDLKSTYCIQCGHDLDGQSYELISRRQVVDIPPVEPIYTQYNQYRCQCPSCHHQQKASYPEGVNAPIQYGSSVEAYVSYLSVYQYLPYKRLKELFKDLFNLNLSEGSIENILKRSAKKCDRVYQQIKEQIEQATFAGSDETGAKVNGEKWWIWAWQNVLNTFLKASPSRGSQTIDETFPEGLPNTIVGSDRWAAQLKTFSKGKQLCVAHLLRDLVWLKESEKHPWTEQFTSLLSDALKLDKKAAEKGIAYQEGDQESLVVEKRLNQLLAVNLIKEQHPETYNFQRSIIKNRNHLFTFLYHLEVPPDNNGSERAIRNVKVKQKVSGQFKTGQQDFCIIRSVIDTLRKRELDLIQMLIEITGLNQYQTTS